MSRRGGAGEYAVPRSAAPLIGKAPGKRRLAASLGVLAVALALLGMFLGTMLKPAFIDSYKTEGNVLWVGYAPEDNCESMLRVSAHETEDAVVLDIVGWSFTNVLPSTAMRPMCTAKFELEQPLGDRVLMLKTGEILELGAGDKRLSP